MSQTYDIATLAKALTLEERKRRLTSQDEATLRRNLKALLDAMLPDSVVEITHGPEERGKDLVIVQQTRFGSENTAIVVKTGNIGGKTMGAITEIADQVE